MGRTFIRQVTQIRNSDTYSDNLTPGVALQSQATIEGDLNALRSITSLLRDVQTGNWYDDLAAPSALDAGTKRGVQNLNDDLHALERKRVLVNVTNLADVTVPAGQNFVVLGAGQLPANLTAAVGAVSTRGTVVAYNATFGAHSLDEVAGSTAIAPKNLAEIVDGSSRDPILSDNRVVYALLQSESSIDGHILSPAPAPQRAQLSFVRLNAAGDDLEAVPFADIEGKVINYASVERKALDDLNEQDFLRGAILDNLGSSTQNRQVAYDNQGTTPVNLTTNATLDLEAPGIEWAIRDDAEAKLFGIIEGSAGGTSELKVYSDVDKLNVDAIENDFAAGLKIRTAGTRIIHAGVNDGVIETTSGDLRVLGAAELLLDDGNQTGSTWAQTDGIKLSDTSAEWDAFKTKFGEVSLLAAITDSGRNGKTYVDVTLAVLAETDFTTGVDMSSGSFANDYDVFLNGELLRPGADTLADNDYYPGTSLATGQIKFEFPLTPGDVVCVVSY